MHVHKHWDLFILCKWLIRSGVYLWLYSPPHARSCIQWEISIVRLRFKWVPAYRQWSTGPNKQHHEWSNIRIRRDNYTLSATMQRDVSFITILIFFQLLFHWMKIALAFFFFMVSTIEANAISIASLYDDRNDFCKYNSVAKRRYNALFSLCLSVVILHVDYMWDWFGSSAPRWNCAAYCFCMAILRDDFFPLWADEKNCYEKKYVQTEKYGRCVCVIFFF